MFNYGNQYMQSQIPRYTSYQPYGNQQMQSQIQQPQMQSYAPQPVQLQGLQGKTVDSIDVVKAMDIPLDGSVSYFPLVDGSAIVTKQLQQDGTSKTVVYRPSEEEKPEEVKKEEYVTIDKFNEAMKDIDAKQFKDLKEEMKTLKRQMRDLSYDIKDKKED